MDSKDSGGGKNTSPNWYQHQIDIDVKLIVTC